MKKQTALLAAIVCALSVTLSACKNDTNDSGNLTSVTSESDSEMSEAPLDSDESVDEPESSPEEPDDESEESADESVWADAVYTEDAEIGEGALTVKIEVTAEDKTVTLTVSSDEDNLEKILTENDLVSGDESEYGLYIKTVNGIRADYDLDGAWWSLEKDGEMTATGAGGITVSDGDVYSLVYTPA